MSLTQRILLNNEYFHSITMVERTTITVLVSQKKSIDYFRALYVIDNGKNISQKQFLGLLLQHYQDHKTCLEAEKVKEILEHSKK